MDKTDKSKTPVLLFKYGGNAMTDDALKKQVLKNMCSLVDKGYKIVIVHGGGPFIKQVLEEAKLESEFIDGHRKTTSEAFGYVEMALKGKVNGNLVSIINAMGYRAVGLSGKDGRIVTASKRLHRRIANGKSETIDMGQVGDVADMDVSLLEILLLNNYIPVITCLADDKEGLGYNINADMFAGHLAGALKAEQYIVLTDVDGLYRYKEDPNSLMRKLRLSEIKSLLDQGIIQGGMIPKVESCKIALNKGAQATRIINGTKPEQVSAPFENETVGTLIQHH